MSDTKRLEPVAEYDSGPVVLTTNEVAEVLRCTPRHVRSLARRGVLKPVRLGRSVRFLRRSVLNSLASLEAKYGY